MPAHGRGEDRKIDPGKVEPMKRILIIFAMIATIATISFAADPRPSVNARSLETPGQSQIAFGPCQNSCLAIAEEYFNLCVQMGYPGEECLQQAAASYDRCAAQCPLEFREQVAEGNVTNR